MANYVIIRIRTIKGQLTKVYPGNFDIENDPDYAVSKKQNPHATEFSPVGKASSRDFVEFWQGQPTIAESVLLHVTAEASKLKKVYKPHVEQEVFKDGQEAVIAASALNEGLSTSPNASDGSGDEEGLRGFIISVFTFAIYFNFFLNIIVGFFAGGFSGVEFSPLLALLGGVFGLILGALTSGGGLILLDIRTHLSLLNKRAS
ncbi:MAG: hypothetical protein PVF65_04140 [Sphingomonadales bacterium]|jgi:hypothetical protein